MNNVEDLKEKVENVENLEETKQIIEDSGKEVSLDEMEEATGGVKNLRLGSFKSRV
ncbi:MAG: hypothetical protein IKQ97_09415 [Eubacterium sp.]|nr:hypothetical protein [Eubacterium sp.]